MKTYYQAVSANHCRANQRPTSFCCNPHNHRLQFVHLFLASALLCFHLLGIRRGLRHGLFWYGPCDCDPFAHQHHPTSTTLKQRRSGHSKTQLAHALMLCKTIPSVFADFVWWQMPKPLAAAFASQLQLAETERRKLWPSARYRNKRKTKIKKTRIHSTQEVWT